MYPNSMTNSKFSRWSIPPIPASHIFCADIKAGDKKRCLSPPAKREETKTPKCVGSGRPKVRNCAPISLGPKHLFGVATSLGFRLWWEGIYCGGLYVRLGVVRLRF